MCDYKSIGLICTQLFKQKRVKMTNVDNSNKENFIKTINRGVNIYFENILKPNAQKSFLVSELKVIHFV